MAFKKNGPGCCGCGSTNCSTSITISLLPLASTGVWCIGPGDCFYDISGTTTAGQTIAISGMTTSPGTTSNLTFSLTYPSTQLPEGNYSIHVYTKSVQCFQPYGVDGRFDSTVSFKVQCPSTKLAITIPAAFDPITATSGFSVHGCQLYWYLDNLPTAFNMTVAASGSAPECGRKILPALNGITPAGNVSVAYKVSSYPFTVTFNASGTDLIPASETRVYNTCRGYTNDWQTDPYVYYDQVPLVVGSGCNPYAGQYHGSPVEGAMVSCSGGITVTGTTAIQSQTTNPFGSTVTRWKSATITNYVYPKVGVTPDQMAFTWIVSFDQYFQPRTYNSTDFATAMSKQAFYGGTECALGGDLGPPIDSKACCGCLLPINKTLHASALGQNFTISWTGSGWGGLFPFTMLAEQCPNPQEGPNPPPTVGTVMFYLFFTNVGFGNLLGTPGLRPFLSLTYNGDGTDSPSQCYQGGIPTTLVLSDTPYGVSYSAVCQPFMATQDFQTSFGVMRQDGSGAFDRVGPYVVNITITE